MLGASTDRLTWLMWLTLTGAMFVQLARVVGGVEEGVRCRSTREAARAGDQEVVRRGTSGLAADERGLRDQQQRGGASWTLPTLPFIPLPRCGTYCMFAASQLLFIMRSTHVPVPHVWPASCGGGVAAACGACIGTRCWWIADGSSMLLPQLVIFAGEQDSAGASRQ
jgi:hypothetical protein